MNTSFALPYAGDICLLTRKTPYLWGIELSHVYTLVARVRIYGVYILESVVNFGGAGRHRQLASNHILEFLNSEPGYWLLLWSDLSFTVVFIGP